MNRKLGMVSSIITLMAVLCFALSMILGNNTGSYIASMFIAWGFVPMICSFASKNEKQTKAFGYTSVAFSAVYAVFIMIVYFAQITTVNSGELTEQAGQLLDYNKFGLFFAYNLLGYAFMALSTFFIAFTISPQNKIDKWLKALLLIHGVFAVSCVIMPMLGIFKPEMAGGDLIGILVLEFWCAYFIPVCILAFIHFKRNRRNNS